jgi:hypothetical protein
LATRSSDEQKISMAIRKLKDDENTPELRKKKIKGDEKKVILGADEILIEKITFTKWSFLQNDELNIAYERQCGDEIFKIMAWQKKLSTKEIKSTSAALSNFVKYLKIECRE